VQFSGSETLSFICEQSSFLAANNANANECRMQMKCNQFVYFSYAYLGFCIGTKQAKLQKFQPFHLRFPRSLGAFEYLNSIRRKTAGWKAGWRAAPHFIVECPVSKVGCPKSDGPCFLGSCSFGSYTCVHYLLASAPLGHCYDLVICFRTRASQLPTPFSRIPIYFLGLPFALSAP